MTEHDIVNRLFAFADNLEDNAARILRNEDRGSQEIAAACVLSLVSKSLLEAFADIIETDGEA